MWNASDLQCGVGVVLNLVKVLKINCNNFFFIDF